MFTIHELLKATKGRLINGSKDITVKGISIDSRTVKKGDAFIAIKGDRFDGHNFIGEAIKKGVSCIIVSSFKFLTLDRKPAMIQVKDTITALGDIASFHRNRFKIPFIAVTGSNGKTTAKEMIATVLSKRFKVLKNEGTKNNQIGLPLTLFNLNQSHDIAVLELGTNHFGEIDYLARICQPNIGIITNIGPAHLEYFNNLEGVFKEKYTLINNLKKPYIAVLNADDVLLRKQIFKKNNKTIIFGFGIKNKSDFYASDVRRLGENIEFLVNERYKFNLKTAGLHNIYNALIAVSIARIFGIEYRDIIDKLSDFDFPPGRLKFVKLNCIRFIDDTYNANPLSLKEALDALNSIKIKGRKILVMGDMLELGRHEEQLHSQIGKDIKGICDIFVGVGRLSKISADAARAYGFDSKNIFICESSHEARNILFNTIFPNEDDIILVKGSRRMKMEEIFKVDQTS